MFNNIYVKAVVAGILTATANHLVRNMWLKQYGDKVVVSDSKGNYNE